MSNGLVKQSGSQGYVWGIGGRNTVARGMVPLKFKASP